MEERGGGEREGGPLRRGRGGPLRRGRGGPLRKGSAKVPQRFRKGSAKVVEYIILYYIINIMLYYDIILNYILLLYLYYMYSIFI